MELFYRDRHIHLWNANRKFMRTFEAIRKHTLVDIYCCYELWQIIDQLSDIPGNLLEVGVWREEAVAP